MDEAILVPLIAGALCAPKPYLKPLLEPQEWAPGKYREKVLPYSSKSRSDTVVYGMVSCF